MTRQVSTDSLRVIAKGGQAVIYDYGDGKVLRVATRPMDFDRIRYEYGVYASLAESTVPMPRAYELVTVNDAPAIVMDKVAGDTMMSLIARNPASAGAKARELARLHLELRTVKAAASMTRTKAKAEFCISRSQILSEQEKGRVLDVLKDLPDGDNLCHGDFHPGNIIRSAGTNYLVDWVGASRGDFRADVAHTFVLLRVVPRLPQMNRLMHAVQRRIARAVANRYLAEISMAMPLDYEVLSRWVLVNSAERTYHGLESEKKYLHAFIEKYFEALARGASERDLYKSI
jgi:aminoglycoside phosphotransferase (APT) family kinase protein